MIIMVYSAFNSASIVDSLGAPEYSYWFVRRAFAPMLERFGIVVPVTDPDREVDTIYQSAQARGQESVFLCFEPPHKMPLGLACRTIPVFAWEFDTIPVETWDDEPRHDWRKVLAATGSAITHSQFSVAAVRRTMGPDYPIWSIPAPVYDANAPFAADARGWQNPVEITISGLVLDSALVDLNVFSLSRLSSDGLESLRALTLYLEEPNRPKQTIQLEGVVYTAIFNPIDGRKNCGDMIGAFIWAFRDTEDATLILKVTHSDPVSGLRPLLGDIAKLGAFRCRVLIVQGMLPDDEYQALLRHTSYAVNSSTNEGQCLPLMEFMSAGRPAVTPCHTAMLDYISDANSFVVRSTLRPYSWPHDPRMAIRTYRSVVSFADLIRCYHQSYHVAKSDPVRYAAMSRASTDALRGFCSGDVVQARLAEVFNAQPRSAPAVQENAVQSSILAEETPV